MKKTQEPAGKLLIELCEKSRIVNAVSNQLHIKQISHDYFQMWHEAESDEERVRITQEYHIEIALAALLPAGLTLGSAVILNMFSPATHIMLFAVTIASIAYLLR